MNRESVSDRRRSTAPGLPMAVIVCVCLSLLSGGARKRPEAAGGGSSPAERLGSQAAPKVPDPWEIIVYEHPNYVGQSVSYRLEPGMRQRLVPIVEPRGQVSSFLLGTKVAVELLPFPNFIASEGDLKLSARFAYWSYPELDAFNDRDISLILFPRAKPFESPGGYGPIGYGEYGPIGVTLSDERASGEWHVTFFPAPEWEWEREYAVPELGYADLDKNVNRVYIGRSRSVQVTLYEQRSFQGASITFPGAVPMDAFSDNLGKYGWSDRAASVKVTWTGPWLNTAPPSRYSTTFGYDVPAGDFKRFFVDGGPNQCEDACDAEPACKGFTWVRPGVQAPQAVCWLKTTLAWPARENVNAASGLKPGAGWTNPVQTPPAPPSRTPRGAKTAVEPPTLAGLKGSLLSPPQSTTATGVKGTMATGQGPYEYGVNLPGGDLRGLFVDGGPEVCEQACAAEAQCQAFTWVKPGVQGPKAGCWLKKSPVPAPQPFPDAVSGYKKLEPPKPPGNR